MDLISAKVVETRIVLETMLDVLVNERFDVNAIQSVANTVRLLRMFESSIPLPEQETAEQRYQRAMGVVK